MGYHLLNTNIKRMRNRGRENPSQYWIMNRCACTTGPKEPYGTIDLGGLAEGDTLFMYETGAGIIAAGTVTKSWDKQTYQEEGIYADLDLYKISVNWFADIRRNPIPASTIRELGYGRFNGTRLLIRNDNTGAAILTAINRRGGHVSPMRNAVSEQTTTTLPKISLEKFLLMQERKSEVGQKGELIAFIDELTRLHEECDCPDPRRFVTQISTDDVSKGYDIESTYPGHERCIEVKTSTIGVGSFYLSDNERNILKQLGPKAWLYIVKLEQDGSGRVVKRLQDPINVIPESAFEPVAWKVTLRDKQNS